MGKYIRKAKASDDVAAVMEMGVRTRAKTLALQRLNKSECMELRSRRLVKPPPVRNSRKAPNTKPPKPEIEKEQAVKSGQERPIGLEDSTEIEGSCGENNLECEARDRNTRESTPCSLIRTGDVITPPGSSTKQRTPNVSIRRVENELQNIIPTERQLEEFFAKAEEQMQRSFIEKYNFDVVNDVPLPAGRYEWIKVTP